jgi:succinate dehydrogenase/fumarate reductase-like Fe-S protein
MSEFVPINEHPSLIRDKKSKALINTDIAALNEYKNKKKLVEDVNELKQEMSDIKHLLHQLVNSLSKDK